MATKTFGIDVSHWQGNFDFKKAKAEGVKFVILKCGGGDSGLYKDSKFDTYYKQATEQGLGVGAYFFGFAKTVEESKKEAEKCILILKGKKFDYPIFYDVEAGNISTEHVKAFCNALEGAGYWCGFYTNVDWYKNRMNGAELAKRYSLWIASWTKTKPSIENVQMWQFGGEINKIRENTIAGVVCDQDYCYVDFPAKIKAKGLNGYGKTASTGNAQNAPSTAPTAPQKKTIDEIAKEVIQGKWGNGIIRKVKLTAAGYDYNTIQARVDQMLK